MRTVRERPRGIHPSAVVSPRAELGIDVTIGPYAVIGDRVHIGDRTSIGAHVVVDGRTQIGVECTFMPFACVGLPAQLRVHDVTEANAGSPLSLPRSKGALVADGGLVMGRGNVVREHVTIHAGTNGAETVLGDDNLVMVGAHLAHDVSIGSSCTLANGVQLAGHVSVADYVTFGGLAAVGQFVRIGEGAFVAAGAMCERHVPPFVVVQGDRAQVRGLNRIGLARRGLSGEEIDAIAQTYAAIFVRGRGAMLAAASAHEPTSKLAERLRRAVIEDQGGLYARSRA
jgi:UDP-N-acetylglucosamine acyltransferase